MLGKQINVNKYKFTVEGNNNVSVAMARTDARRNKNNVGKSSHSRKKQDRYHHTIVERKKGKNKQTRNCPFFCADTIFFELTN